MEYRVFNENGQLVGYSNEEGIDVLMAEGLCCVESEQIATDVEPDAAGSLPEYSALTQAFCFGLLRA